MHDVSQETQAARDASVDEHHFVSAADGHSIATRYFAPSPSALRCTVVIAPAMGVPQRFYADFARWLAAHGAAVLTFDYRGTGASLPAKASAKDVETDLKRWAELDCAVMVEEAERLHPGVPIFWIGHSVGAQLFGLIPNHARVKAMMSIAAGSGYWRYNARPLRYYVLWLWLVVVPVAVRVTGYFPGKKLRMVGDLPHGVVTQWRAWCLSERYMGDEGAVIRDLLAAVRTPITAMSIQDDEMMTLHGTRALFDLYSSANVTLRRLRPRELGVPSIGHFGFFRARGREKLWPLITEWLRDQTGAQDVLEVTHAS